MSAKDTLKKLTAWDTIPALTDGEIDELLADSCLADADNLVPADPEWSPTYDLNAAASAGWLIKAGRALAIAETDPASDLFDNCIEMSRSYSRRAAASVRVGPE